jgi:glycosyltransferase involved in cell wall biosynthesis
MIKLSIVLPCYNEGLTIKRLVDEFRVAFAGEQGIELILVNNGSTDDTKKILKNLLPLYPGCRSVYKPFSIKLL